MKNDGLQRTSIQLSRVLVKRINAEAKRNGESASEVIRRAIDRYFMLQDMIRVGMVDAPTAAEIEKRR